MTNTNALARLRERLPVIGMGTSLHDSHTLREAAAALDELERELTEWKSRAQANEDRRVEAAKLATDAQREVSRLEREIRELRKHA